MATEPPPNWLDWVEPLNAAAGVTLVVVGVCVDCGATYPASPRQRVSRCVLCKDRRRAHRLPGAPIHGRQNG